ncbi:MAG: DUF2341 domain-containing protein [Spirochaetaceae bacterium]|nr:DUF2341 domain-containing protein [Spirochaetaceae bacterium]
MKNIILSIVTVLFVIECTADGAWDLLRNQADIFQTLGNYDNRIKVTINNSSQNEDLTNFPVLVILNTSRVTYSTISADGSGIKFISSDFTEELSYEVEEWNSGGNSFFWVKVPSITAISNSEYFWIYLSTYSNTDSTTPTDVWSNNYLAVWHMNDSGSLIKDSGLNGIDGTGGINGQEQPAVSTGIIAGAQKFDGTLDGITVTPGTVFDDMGPVSFSFWMLDEVYSNYDYILKKGEFIIRLRASKAMRFRVSYDNQNLYTQFDNSWIQDIWRAFSITWTGADGANKVVTYADGEDLGNPDSKKNGKDNRIPNAGIDLTIGSDLDGTNSFNGKLDEIRISNVVRTSEWIKAQYLSMTDTFLTYGTEEEVP